MSTYIVFDCYHTLLHKKNLEKTVQEFAHTVLKKKIHIRHIKRAYDVMYDRHKFKHPRFETLTEREDFYRSYNAELFKVIGISISPETALMLNRYLKKSSWARYPDTLTTLKCLKKRNVPMGVLANWTKTLSAVLEETGLASYFNAIHSSHDLEIEKPNPEVFTKALGNSTSAYDKVYYVGNDYELDIVPAKKAGLTPILIDRDGRYPDSVDCMRINKLTGIEDVLFT